MAMTSTSRIHDVGQDADRQRAGICRAGLAGLALTALAACGWLLAPTARSAQPAAAGDATDVTSAIPIAAHLSSPTAIPRHWGGIELCQANCPARGEPAAAPCRPSFGGDSGGYPPGYSSAYSQGNSGGCYGPCSECVPWQPGSFGEYVDRPRLPHVPVYRLRVNDEIRCVFRMLRNETHRAYRLNVGDEIQVESFTDPNLNRSVIVQPDGSITMRLLGQVEAAHLTVAQLREASNDSIANSIACRRSP